jgi:hypothetical protein
MAAIYDALGNYVGEDTTGSNGGTTTVVSNPPNLPTTNTVPNTTTNTKKVVYQTAAKDAAVKPASDPSQFPAYDDNGNLMPGFKINDETGQTYYAGVGPNTKDPHGLLAAEDEAIAQSDAAAYASASVGPRDPYGLLAAEDAQLAAEAAAQGDAQAFNHLSVPRDPNGVLAAEDAQLAAEAAAQGDAEAYGHLSTTPVKLNDPYSGLTPDQIKKLGGADPTDPYIRARLGIPQLPGSILNVTPGFGFGNLTTNLPSIDNALGTIKGLFSGFLGGGTGGGSGLSSLFTNFSATVGGLFGGTPTASTTAATTGSGVAALVAPANTFTAKDTAGILAAEDQALADQAAAQGDAAAFQTVAPRDPNGVLAAEDAQLAAEAAAQGDADAFGKLSVPRDPNGVLAAEDQAIADEQAAQADAEAFGKLSVPRDPNGVLAAEDAALAEEAANRADAAAYDHLSTDPYGVLAAEDAAIAEQEAAQNDAAAFQTVGPTDPYGVLAAEDQAIADEEAAAYKDLSVGPRDPYGVLAAEDQAIADEQAAQSDAAAYDHLTQAPSDVLSDEDAALYDELAARPDRNAAINTTQTAALVDQEQGSQEAAMKSMAQKQATIQARYKQPGNTDWRVRLSLAPGAKYLYNAGDADILKPLAASGGTDGVIFPYTPSITTTYSANYEQYDLVHSNYRGLFYKNSRVGDIQIRGVFTAQNTTEANYLLAVIHFFRSATKMFYGQDPQRGTPPPICLLNGLGGYQFSDHPVVISSFNYTLPNDVDYIRTTNPNNFGLNLNNRYNPAGASLPAGGSLSGLNRLVNALLPKGAQPPTPAPNTVVGSVTNNTPASYVPTKMEIDITLIPAQTRAQVSKQFSLAGFANGDLLKGGFW